MKIAYDPVIFLAQKYGGISRYIVEVASFLTRKPWLKIYVIAPCYINEYLKFDNGFTLLGFKASTFSWVPFAFLKKAFHLFSNLLAIAIGDVTLRCIRPQIIHESYYFPFPLGPKKTKRVLTIHDMIHEKYPSFYTKDNKIAKFKSAAAARADHIICNSQSTKRDVLELLGIPPEKVFVIYLGFSEHKKLSTKPDDLECIVGDFLLFVGLRNGYKNFRSLMLAYSQSESLRTQFSIVCFGGQSFSDAEMQFMTELGIDRAKMHHYVGNDEKLQWFYQNASAFIYPSLYEGFGIPPLEAMANHCPVICSNNSSIPEVVGEAGEYFDPMNPQEIRLAIEKVVFDPNRCADLVIKGVERTVHFSWEKCALQTLAVYENLITPPAREFI